MDSEIYVFIDESGDLGRYGTEYFTIASIVVKDPKVLERVIKRVRRRKLKKKYKELPELKANKSNAMVRKYVLEMVKVLDCHIFTIIVHKEKIHEHLFEVKDRLYNYICRLLLDEININSKKLNIIIDKKHTNTLVRENFDEYINKMLNKKIDSSIKIDHCDSMGNKPLQVVDFIAWSISRKFNHNDDTYYAIIKEKIVNQTRMILWD